MLVESSRWVRDREHVFIRVEAALFKCWQEGTGIKLEGKAWMERGNRETVFRKLKQWDSQGNRRKAYVMLRMCVYCRTHSWEPRAWCVLI